MNLRKLRYEINYDLYLRVILLIMLNYDSVVMVLILKYPNSVTAREFLEFHYKHYNNPMKMMDKLLFTKCTQELSRNSKMIVFTVMLSSKYLKMEIDECGFSLAAV